MNYYLFKVLNSDLAEEELVSKGLQDIYKIEEDETGEILIGGRALKKPVHLKYSEFIEEKRGDVDWEEQWALFAENFSEGRAHINLERFGKNATLLLLPGAGFGDLSHPTTYLCLNMMQKYVKEKPILDIGTGSGILALAALLLGASSAIGIDIDEKALKHAKQNALENHLKARFLKSLPANVPPSNITLINMILPEQKRALRRIARYNALTSLWIVSGILVEQKEEYLKLTKQWGWEVKEEHMREGWLGWVFNLKSRA